MKYPLATLLLSICLLPASAQWTGAVEDTITRNTIREETRRQSLAVDDGNRLHLLHVRDNGGSWELIYHQRPQNSAWGPESVVTTAPVGNAALAVDRITGKPYVAWEQPGFTGTDILMAELSGGNWLQQPVTTGLTQNTDPAIAVDGQGDVHLAWVREVSSGTYRICYATNKSGAWQVHVLSSSTLGPFGSGATPDLVADPIGRVHIAYRGGNFGTYRIHVAYNTAPGDTNFQYRILTTPNAEDLSCRIAIDQDTTVHLLSSGNDGFGFPTHAHYMTKPAGAASFGTAVPVVNGFSAGVGDLYVTQTGEAHAVLDEISGNIYTGNVLYTNSTGGWNASYLLQNGGDYGSNLVLDEEGFGYCAVYAGNTFQDQEIVVYGRSFGTGLQDPEQSMPALQASLKNGVLKLRSEQAVIRRVSLLGLNGQQVFSEEMAPNASFSKSLPGLAGGVYYLEVWIGDQTVGRKLINE